MKPRVVLGGIAFVVLAGLFAWFWLLASVPKTEAMEMTLKVEKSPVMVKAAGEGSFQEAKDGMTLTVGDTVKTETDGRAVVQFFGMAESRLDGATELVVTQAAQDAAVPDSLRVSVALSAGRVWSRVLHLFDLESGFSVETPGVVATVRGTAFDVGFGEDQVTRVWVSNSAVDVLPAGANDRSGLLARLRDARVAFAAATSTEGFATITELAQGALPAGEMARYDAQGVPLLHRPLSQEDRDTLWFQENTAQDRAFAEEAVARRRAELVRLGGVRPDRWHAGITVWSEQLHVAMVNEDRREWVKEQYLVRRLAQLLALAEDGKSGLASQEFARLEQELRNQLRDDPSGVARMRIRSALLRVARLFDGVDVQSPLYPFKQRMEDLFVMLPEADSAAAFFARLMAVDARITEASRLIDVGSFESALAALDAGRGGIENVGRDLEPMRPLFAPARQEAVMGKLLALMAREAAERVRLAAAERAFLASPVPVPTEEDTTTPTSTAPVTPTPTVPTIPVPTVPPSTPTPQIPIPDPQFPVSTSQFTGIRLAVGVGTLTVGTPVPMAVIADRANGSNQDVTTQSTFRVVSGRGTISGVQFTPTSDGVIVVEASYNDNGTVRTTQTGVSVVAAAPVFQSLVISPTWPTVQAGGRITLTATANYADGSTQDVTSDVSWSASPSTAGSMSGNVFIATPPSARTSTTTATVQASYAESGITRTGSVTVTIN